MPNSGAAKRGPRWMPLKNWKPRLQSAPKNARALELVDEHRREVLAQDVKEASEELQSLKDKLVASNAALASATSDGTTVKRITYHRIPEIATNTPVHDSRRTEPHKRKVCVLRLRRPCCTHGGNRLACLCPKARRLEAVIPSPEHHDETAQTQLACAVQKDLLENFQENLRVRHEGRKRDVAPMYPLPRGNGVPGT